MAPIFSALFLVEEYTSKFGQPIKDSAIFLLPSGPKPALFMKKIFNVLAVSKYLYILTAP